MARRFIFKKWNTSPDPTKCDFCSNQILFFITDKKTGEESWCCTSCALTRFKIKRLRPQVTKYPLPEKKSILAQNSLIKNSENTPEEGGSE